MTASRANVIITGFMGTGKSVVARKVAQELGHTWVDMDQVIEQRAGKSIAAIFQQEGEPAFRKLERALLEELCAGEGLVIATGGGALVDASNRELALNGHVTVCLDCALEELRYRLSESHDRPMLWGDALEARLANLWEARKEAYAAVPHHIDTTHRAIDQVADEIIRLYTTQPKLWLVRTPTGEYPVYLQHGGIDHLGDLLKSKGLSAKIVVVSDEYVWPLYGKRILDSLWKADLSVDSVTLPAGEQNKNLDTVRLLYDRFIDAELDRSGAVIALGGGVITDMAGLAAATFMRGVPLVQVPTTLLGMVDASVGGKVAVDHPRGKNLIGAFVEPLMVMLDPWTLQSLPEIEQRSGLAEIIKAGVIADVALFDYLEHPPATPDLRWMIERALQVKIDVVEQDPYEHGRRAILNLGHTFAHAFEVLSDYQLHHGLAVGVGMAAAVHLAELRGLCSTDTRQRMVDILQRHRLPTRYDAQPPDVIYKAMWADKKRRGSRLRFVLPREIGDVIIDGDVPESEVLATLERIRE